MNIDAVSNLHRPGQAQEQHVNGREPVAARRLRIAICPPEYLPLQRVMRGEPESATYIIQGEVARGLAARGHRLIYLAPSVVGSIVRADDIAQPDAVKLSWTDSIWFRAAAKSAWQAQQALGIPYLNVFENYRLADAARQVLPGHDVVYERNGIYKDGVARACRQLGLPYVLYVEADEVLEYDVMGQPITGLLRRRAQAALRTNLHAADCVICVSHALRRHLESTYAIAPDKFVVLPNVADVHKFRPNPAVATTVRSELGIGEAPLVIFVGNFYQWHDVSTLLAAFAQARRVAPAARMLLVGDGECRRAMMDLAESLGLANAVQFTGLVAHDAVPRLLAAADIAVVPYPALTTDIWLSPLKLFEYMAAGKAVIASAVGQLPDVVAHGRNGLLVSPGEVDALAAALELLLSDSALANALGAQARSDAVQHHSWEQYLDRLEQLFAAVIARQSVCGM